MCSSSSSSVEDEEVFEAADQREIGQLRLL